MALSIATAPPILADDADLTRPLRPEFCPPSIAWPMDGGAHYGFADSFSQGADSVTMTGNVEWYQQNWRFFADRIHISSPSTAIGEGNIHAERGNTPAFSPVRFWADEFASNSSQSISFTNSVFTRCAGARGALPWQVKAKRTTYDRERETVVVENALLSFYQVPILYSPYSHIPLTRRSGFLTPFWGQYSLGDLEGVYAHAPLYLALSDHYDATLGITHLEHRGMLWSPEFRYLSRGGNGRIEGLYFPDDPARRAQNAQNTTNDPNAETPPTSVQAWRANIAQSFTPNVRFTSNWAVFEPRNATSLLPNKLKTIGKGAGLTRFARLNYQHGAHRVKVERSDYYSLESDAKDGYIEAPALTYEHTWPLAIGTLNHHFSYTDHQRPNLDSTLEPYQRTSAEPTWRYERNAWRYYLVSEWGGKFNRYAKTDAKTDSEAVQSATNNNLERATDIATYYARHGARGRMHHRLGALSGELSPMLYHLYSPPADPGAIPIGSISARNISAFSQLTYPERYTRSDYLGGANRIVWGVSERVRYAGLAGQLTVGKNMDLDNQTDDEADEALTVPVDEAYENTFIEGHLRYGPVYYSLFTEWRELHDFPSDDYLATLHHYAQYDTPRAFARLSYFEDFAKPVEGNPADEEANNRALTGGFFYRFDERFGIAYAKTYDMNAPDIFDETTMLSYYNCCWQFHLRWDDAGRFDTTAITARGEDKPIEHNRTISVQLMFVGLGSVGSDDNLNADTQRLVRGLK